MLNRVDAHEIHRRLVASGIPALVEVELPPSTYQRVNDTINLVLKGYPLPKWTLRLLDAQDGLTAGYYHCRRVETIEHGVDAIARQIYANPPADMPETNTSFSARQLTYEYQAFIFALRRSFDYLGAALTMALGCPRASGFKDVPKKLGHRDVSDRSAADAIAAKVPSLLASFPEVFGTQKGHSTRDRIAHVLSVPGGQFTLWFRPGQPVAVELNGGGERLSLSGDPSKAPGRLTAILVDRLVRFEDAFMNLTADLPAIAAARAASSSPAP